MTVLGENPRALSVSLRRHEGATIWLESHLPLAPGSAVKIECGGDLLLGEVSCCTTENILRVEIEHALFHHGDAPAVASFQLTMDDVWEMQLIQK